MQVAKKTEAHTTVKNFMTCPCASQPEVKPDTDVRDVVLEELPIRRRPIIQLQHEHDCAAWMTIRSNAQSLDADPRADGA
jgi:hypothetical protein